NHGAGGYGFGVPQYEQQQPGSSGYALGSFGAPNGGSYSDSSSYSLPETTQNEHRFGGPVLPRPPPPASGMGQYASGPPVNVAVQPDAPNATAGGANEYPSSPTSTDYYAKKSKAFLKVHKS
ncbi:unnamed protein product, partial [Gongylonema pulchrum]|uniref:CG10616 n=1 Tax=Gongylonema pulchrum TaxID=637853 RepID=A0A183EFG2_9BILA